MRFKFCLIRKREKSEENYIPKVKKHIIKICALSNPSGVPKRVGVEKRPCSLFWIRFAPFAVVVSSRELGVIMWNRLIGVPKCMRSAESRKRTIRPGWYFRERETYKTSRRVDWKSVSSKQKHYKLRTLNNIGATFRFWNSLHGLPSNFKNKISMIIILTIFCLDLSEFEKYLHRLDTNFKFNKHSSQILINTRVHC